MNMNDNNFLFNPNTWIKTRSEGISKFAYRSVGILSVFLFLMLYFGISHTKGNVRLSASITAIVGINLLFVQISTWYWKEYKFNRYANNKTSITNKDQLISIANKFRIVYIISLILVFIYFMYIYGYLLSAVFYFLVVSYFTHRF